MLKSDKKIKRKIGALIVLGMFAMLILSTLVFAQSWGTGGSDIVSYPIIIDSDGSSTDEVFAVLKDTNNPATATELFRVQEDGRVGIGTTSPSHKLEISDSDTTHTRAGLYIAQTGAISGTGYGIYATKTGASDYNLAGYFTATGATTNYGTWTTATGAHTTNIGGYFSATGATTNYGLLVGSGVVGIGDITPDFGLEITLSTANGFFGVSSGGSDGNIFTITPGGNVGIGTATPTLGKLQIDTAPSASCALYIANPMGMASNNGAINIGGRLFIDEDEIQSAVGRTLYINNDNNVNLIINNGGGDVGIGTTTPDAKLDVELGSGGAAEIGNIFNSATGDWAVAMGESTTAEGRASFAVGQGATASGIASFASGGSGTEAGGDGSVAIGWDADASGYISQAFGMDADATGGYSGAWGAFVGATSSSSFVIGKGEYLGSSLVNNIASSFMVGFDSTTPTLFVDGNSVGIGTTTTGATLDVRGSAIFNEDGGDNDFRIEGDTETDLFFVDASTDNIGIGIVNPSTTLHVDGDVAFGAGLTLTILDGVVTATHSYHQIETAGGADADDLDTISDGDVAGQILIIRAADDDHTVTARDGWGNLVLQSGNNFILDDLDDTLVLMYDGSNWLELSRSDNS